MRLGILQAGKVNAALAGRFDEYPVMFARLFQGVDPSVETRAWAVVDGVLPASPGECDAWLITGSSHGVYDDLPWIEPLKAFLRSARAAGVPTIGICFGHQIMAEAFGGRAEKSPKGWGIGVAGYEVAPNPPHWMADAPAEIRLHAIHQDQVTALPDDATCLAASPFCRYAMLAYGDPEAPEAISIQPHPEFDAVFMRALLERFRGDRMSEAVVDPALAKLGATVDGAAFARWTLAWLNTAIGRRRAA